MHQCPKDSRADGATLNEGRPLKYILQGHEPVRCDDPIVWAKWFESGYEKRIVRQEQIGDYWISTVFLCLDHNWNSKGPPILFETMVFIGERSTTQDATDPCRYATWEEAAAGHREVCRRLRDSG